MNDRSPEYVDKILGLAPPTVLEQGPFVFSNQKLHHVGTDPEIQPLQFRGLQAMVDYLIYLGTEDAEDAVGKVALFLHVESPLSVVFRGPLAASGWRVSLARSTCPPGFPFGEWKDQESFIISLSTQFRPTDSLRALVKVAGNVTGEEIRVSEDDGVTQEASVRAGVSLKNRADLPSPLALVPYRTFREVEQPESFFVLRAKDTGRGPAFALFEADGGAWQIEAMASIAMWLRDAEVTVPVIG